MPFQAYKQEKKWNPEMNGGLHNWWKDEVLAQYNNIKGGVHTGWPIFSDRTNWSRQEGVKLLLKKRIVPKTNRAETQIHHFTTKLNWAVSKRKREQ